MSRYLGVFQQATTRRAVLRMCVGGIALGATGVLAACGGTGAATAPTAAATVASQAAAPPPTATPAAAAAAQPTAAATVASAAAVPTATTAAAAAAPTTAPAPTAPVAAAPGTLSYWTYVGMGGPDVDPITIKAYNAKYPNVKVEYQALPFEPYFQKIDATLASGSGFPDVWNTAPTFYYEYVKRGQLANLQPFVNRKDINLDDFFTTFLDQWKAPADYYGMPRDWVVGALYYNKGLFDAAGVAYPDSTWTWDSVRQAAQKLTKADGGRVSQWGLNFGNDRVAVDPLIYADGGAVLSPGKKGPALINQPQAVQAVTTLVDLVVKDKVAAPPGFFTGQPDPFGTGKVAMAINGTWAIGDYRKITQFGWDLALYPKGTQSRVVYGGPDGLVISKATKALDDSWNLVKLLVGPDCPLDWYTKGENFAPFNKALAAQWQKQAGPPTWATVVDTAQYARADFNAGYNEWQKAKISELDKAFLGKVSPQQACDAAAKAVDAVLQKNGDM